MAEPTNERELVQTREFIKDAPNKVEQQVQLLHEVYKHYLLLEEFSFMYQDQHIETYWYQKTWPLEISSSLTDGSYMIKSKEVIFMAKLDQEKDNFIKSIEGFKQSFEKIKKFKDLNSAAEYSADAFQLRENLNQAFDKVRQFNDREALFD